MAEIARFNAHVVTPAPEPPPRPTMPHPSYTEAAVIDIARRELDRAGLSGPPHVRICALASLGSVRTCIVLSITA